MKYRKDNKTYDTENSIHLGSYTDLYSFDFYSITETLYRTWDGTFYLIREDDSPSKENRENPSQSSSSNQVNIFILSEDDAKQWYKKYQM